MPDPRKVFWLLFALLIVFGSAAPGSARGIGDEIKGIDRWTGEQVAKIESLLAPALDVQSDLPLDPVGALTDGVATLSAELGFPQDPGPAIRLAGLSEEVAGRLANVVDDLLACHRITTKHFAAIEDRLEAVARDGDGLKVSGFEDIRACAQDLWASSTELELGLEQTAGLAETEDCTPIGARSIDVWPVLRLEGTCTNTLYLNDYLLTIDFGGKDTYVNNVGSNMVDVKFSPPTSAVIGAQGVGPARGCQRAIPGLAAADCIPTASVLLDLAGADKFGIKQTPDHDLGCTNDLVVRRMVTGGVGFLGVGILRDAASSNDVYTGKTGSLGAGHIFGVGILSDEGGNDTYSAVRNSQGFALLGGVGILNDEEGADKYDFYMPAPIDPTAPNETEGAGGVRDDQDNGLCDRIPRFVQGTANVLAGTIGILFDEGGKDRYRGVFSDFFNAPGQIPSTRAGSLGFGNNQALGIFSDRGGDADVYVVDNEPVLAGIPARGNDVRLLPGNDSTSAGGGAGLFSDR